jgi:hypothetical protein
MKSETVQTIIDDLAERLRLSEMEVFKLNEEVRILKELCDKNKILYEEIPGSSKTMA